MGFLYFLTIADIISIVVLRYTAHIDILFICRNAVKALEEYWSWEGFKGIQVRNNPVASALFLLFPHNYKKKLHIIKGRKMKKEKRKKVGKQRKIITKHNKMMRIARNAKQ